MRISNGFFFCLLSDLSNDNIISAKKGQVLKRVWISEFESENRTP